MIYRSSQISTAKQCITKSFFQYHLGLVRQGSSGVNPDLFFGTAVHKAVEIYLKEDFEKATAYLDSLDFPPRSQKTKVIAKILLNLFRFKFKDEFISSEQDFTFQLAPDITLKGRYDIVAKNITPYIIDLKTNIPFYLLPKPNDQFISYYIAAQEDFEGIDKVVLYNLDPGSVDINVSLVTYSQREIEAWKQETIAFLRFYQKCVDEEILVKSNACLAFGRRCEYHDLCTASSKVREMLISNAFEVNEENKRLEW